MGGFDVSRSLRLDEDFAYGSGGGTLADVGGMALFAWTCSTRFGVEALDLRVFFRGTGGGSGVFSECPRARSTLGRLKRLKSDILDDTVEAETDFTEASFNGDGGSALSSTSVGRSRKLFPSSRLCNAGCRDESNG